MENQTEHNQQEELWRNWEKSHRRGKIFGGILIVTAGSLFLAKELGAQIPEWVFTWKMLLIAIGLLTAVKHKFLHPAWIALVMVGGAFLIGDLYPALALKHIIWPVVLIIFGLFIIFKPRRRHKPWHQWKDWHDKHQHWHKKHHHSHYGYGYNCGTETATNDEYIDSTTFMGGVKKNVTSRNFKGGDITNVFGGAEVNLSQADFEGSATLDITNVFGGTKLVIPSHWKIQSDLVSIFGSIEDKRPIQPDTAVDASSKILILRGVCFFGGVDIKSY
ncbi:MAG: hypothetical protein JST26_11430 [Bacteroidetes bacterium]|nr:hypothetical protein [Bacteroidota bacterium]